MKIGTETIHNIKKVMDDLLHTYSEEINAAMAEEGTVSVSLPVKIKEKGESLDVTVGIGFIKTRVKDEIGFTVSSQKEIFTE